MTMQNQPSALPPEEPTQAAAPANAVPGTVTATALTLSEPIPDADYEHVHHIIIGSPHGIEETIKHLHARRYIERHRWTPLIPIREEGLHITPAQGQVLSYLIRQAPKGER